MRTYKTLALTGQEMARRSQVASKDALRRRLGTLLGRVAVVLGPSEAARLAGVSRYCARYWKRKVADPNFHPGCWGGHRDNAMTFGSIENDVAVQMVVYIAICENPDTSFRNLLDVLRSIPGLEGMSASWLSRTIHSWGWEWGRVRLVSKNKYSPQNIDTWVNYAVSILDVPLNKVSICPLVRLSCLTTSSSLVPDS
jgi:hypothetical protein